MNGSTASMSPTGWRFISLIVLLLTLALAGTLHGSAAAETITVSATGDELNIDGDCSLREAIQAANSDAPVDACPAGHGSDTVLLPAATFTLSLSGAGEDNNTTGDFDVRSDVTIQGVGPTVTIIDAQQLDRVFDVFAGATVHLTTLRVTNGKTPNQNGDGGGIRNAGTLTLSSVLATNHTCGDWGDGGGIWNSGSLTLSNSTVSGSKAGFDGNRDGYAGYGGGVWNSGTTVLTNSTLSGNSAGAGNWGDGAGGNGGAIWNSGNVSLIFSTISGNQAAGGGDANGSGGGIYNGNSVNIKNSLIANNAVGSGPGYEGLGPDCYGPIVSQDYNLIENTSNCSLSGVTTHNTTGQDPNVGLLQNNGGGVWTLALQSPSPAVNKLPPETNGCGSGDGAVDERKVARPQYSACDLGAFELAPPVAPTVQPQCRDATLRLVWTLIPNDSGYKVHQDGRPYFTPEAATLAATLPADAAFWDKANACSDSESYYYIVLGVNSAASDSGQSSRVGKFAFSLSTGNSSASTRP